MANMNESSAYFWLTPNKTRSAVGGLRQAVDEGVLSPSDYVQTMTSCQSCGTPEICRTWLAANDLPSGTCRNAPLISELRASR
jgi:hypothetical protein